MKKLYSYTVFIDILGYSNRLKNISSDDDAEKIFNLLDTIELFIQKYYQGLNAKNSHKEYDMHYTFFSDCIILSFTPKANLNINEDEFMFYNGSTLGFIFTWLINIQFETLLNTGFLLRGGISIKNIYWKDKKVVGPGLIEAYQLESKEADWARIILSKDLTNDTELIKYVNTTNNTNKVYLAHDLVYQLENESYSYYNYIGRMFSRLNYKNNSIGKEISYETLVEVSNITEMFLQQHQQIILKNLKHPEIKIRNKYIKLKDYHNQSIKDFIEKNSDFLAIEAYMIN